MSTQELGLSGSNAIEKRDAWTKLAAELANGSPKLKTTTSSILTSKLEICGG